MAEITTSTVRLAAGLVYLGAFAVCALGLRSVNSGVRRYVTAFVGILALAGLSLLGQAGGLGTVQIGSGSVNALSLAADAVAFTVVYGGVAALGGASPRLGAFIVAVTITPLIALAIAPLFEGAIVLILLVAFFLPYPVMLYAYLGPVWRRAQTKSDEQRLMYWKARNIILYVYGVILLYILVAIAGIIPTGALSTALVEYTSMFSSIGIAGFLVYTFSTQEVDVSLFNDGTAADG